MDFGNILILAQKELRDARKNRWFLLYAIAFTGLSLALAWISLSGTGDYGLAGFGRTSASLINLILLIVPLMGLTLGALSLAGEREQGSLLYLMAQPINQIELLSGQVYRSGTGFNCRPGTRFWPDGAAHCPQWRRRSNEHLPDFTAPGLFTGRSQPEYRLSHLSSSQTGRNGRWAGTLSLAAARLLWRPGFNGHGTGS